MNEAKLINLKKNALFCPDTAPARPVEGGRIFTWNDKIPWHCTTKTRRLATVRPRMELSFSPNGNYQLSYIQDIEPLLHRMRWTYRLIALDSKGSKLFDFLVDTRELTVYPETKSWIYQIHTGSEVNITRKFDDIAAWDRDISGNGWFKID